MKIHPDGLESKEIIGSSSTIRLLREKISNLLNLDIPVYIQGDTGTGKDLIARTIAGQKLIHIDSTNFASDWYLLIQNYTSKTSQKLHIRGERIKITSPIYIDKLENLDTEGQAILFYILDNQEFITSKKETIDFTSRILLASNKELPRLVKEGVFRRDLFQKINVLRLVTPTLKEIKSDIPILVNHFINEFKTKYKKNIQRLSEKLIQFILQYDWPGNVAQLRSMLEGMVILSSEKVLDIRHVPSDFLTVSAMTFGGKLSIVPGVSMEEYEKEILRENLKFTNGNRDKCAKLLGISERTLYRKIKEYKLE